MFNFAYIAPIAYLNFIPSDSNLHMSLAHLLENKTYRDFYQDKIELGRTVILDNSAFELGAPLDVLSIVKEYRYFPSVIVAPDLPGGATDDNFKGVKKFVNQVKNTDHGDDEINQWADNVQIMAVPHAPKDDHYGWMNLLDQYQMMEGVDIIGVSFLACNNAFSHITGSDDGSLNRIKASYNMMTLLGSYAKQFNYHYLGMVQPNELFIQKQIGLMKSCDSSSPFWHAINGIKYDNSFGGLKNGKIPLPVDFNHCSGLDLASLNHNVNVIRNFQHNNK